MFNKKFLSGILCAVMLLSTISVAAATFSDVENDPTVSWAKPYITEMSQKGYIKGYEDLQIRLILLPKNLHLF